MLGVTLIIYEELEGANAKLVKAAGVLAPGTMNERKTMTTNPKPQTHRVTNCLPTVYV